MRRILVGLHGLLSIAILALVLHAAAPAAALAPHPGAIAVASSDVTRAAEGCCENSSQAKPACCDPCHCDTVLAAEPIALESAARPVAAAASVTMPFGISIRPQQGPPRIRA
ncbi:MAG TPA: hypothetical protein VHE77_11690 [Dongiaceae bacterium]|nr:hypothetical protein [Dongiaceae bacterium]